MEATVTDRSAKLFFFAAFVGICILAMFVSLTNFVVVRSNRAAHQQYLALLQEMRENQKLLREMVDVPSKVSEITLDLMRSKSESNGRQLEDILKSFRIDRKSKEGKLEISPNQKILAERANGNSSKP